MQQSTEMQVLAIMAEAISKSNLTNQKVLESIPTITDGFHKETLRQEERLADTVQDIDNLLKTNKQEIITVLNSLSITLETLNTSILQLTKKVQLLGYVPVSITGIILCSIGIYYKTISEVFAIALILVFLSPFFPEGVKLITDLFYKNK